MSVLTELRRLFDAYDAAVAEYKSPLPVDEATFLKREEAVYAATGRLEGAFTRATQRALLNAAEAAQAVVEYIDQDYFTVDEEKVVVALIAALAPLTKEADSE